MAETQQNHTGRETDLARVGDQVLLRDELLHVALAATRAKTERTTFRNQQGRAM
jgi:hypothetical protein